MASLIKIKRSAVPGKVPTTSDLQLGELAISTYDGKLFLKRDNGTETIVEIGAGSSFSGSYPDLTNKPSIPSALDDLSDVAITSPSNGQVIKFNGTTWANATDSTFSGSYTDLTNKPSFATVATSGAYSDLSGTPSLATVATSGSYTDLTNKPTIPSTLAALTGDVAISSPATNQVLKYDGTAWANASDAGITTLNTLTSASQTFAIGTGNSGGAPYWASASGVHTLHLPNATNAIKGFVGTGTQTFGGRKMFLDGATVGDTIGTSGRLHVWNSGTTPAVYAQQASTGTGDLFRAVTSGGSTVFSVSSAGAITTTSTVTTTGSITCGGTFVINSNAITSTTDINLTPGSSADRVIFNNLGTTGSSANAVFGSNGGLVKSTSSIRYKTDVETLSTEQAEAIFDSFRAVRYTSLASEDSQQGRFFGLIAEEVAAIEPMLVSWANIPAVSTTDLVPDGVAYDRLAVLLIPLVQDLRERVVSLEAQLQVLLAKVATLESE
jgi:hypothetical protein